MPGDVYIDDGQHYALSIKFWRDFHSEGRMEGEPPPLTPAESAEVLRDARAVYRELDERQQAVDMLRGYCVLVDEASAAAEFELHSSADAELDTPGKPTPARMQHGMCLSCRKGPRIRWFLCGRCFTMLPVRLRRIMYGSDGQVGTFELIKYLRGMRDA